MASGLSGVVVLVLCVLTIPSVSGGRNCEAFTDKTYSYHEFEFCRKGFCCGSCLTTYCCQDSFMRFTEDHQEECAMNSALPMGFGIGGFVIILLIVICCCVCPCCCLYKMCRKPQPVIATTTHTTVVTTTPHSTPHYAQQPIASSGQSHSYQGAQYPPYQPVPVQPAYGSQPTMPYQGQPFKPGPPPTYQEATFYPPNPMPYSQAAFTPGQPAYPLQPPTQPPQPNAPPAQPDYLSQPAYNPNYVTAPPTTG
ncbi:hypothetical protein PAMP_017596 [Pampus punctatissimus]